jgi:hypothetical protein
VSVAGAGIATAASGALFTDEDAATMDVSSGWIDVAVGGPTRVLWPSTTHSLQLAQLVAVRHWWMRCALSRGKPQLPKPAHRPPTQVAHKSAQTGRCRNCR